MTDQPIEEHSSCEVGRSILQYTGKVPDNPDPGRCNQSEADLQAPYSF